MDKKQLIISFWKDVAEQNPLALQKYFCENAIINWHDTDESFTVPEYIIANCEYPNSWNGVVERIEISENSVISVSKVWTSDKSMVCHAVSFFEFDGDKIILLNEYWGDYGSPPQWRIEKCIGRSIK